MEKKEIIDKRATFIDTKIVKNNATTMKQKTTFRQTFFLLILGYKLHYYKTNLNLMPIHHYICREHDFLP